MPMSRVLWARITLSWPGSPALNFTPFLRSAKVAVIRDPVTGFDATESFEPGSVYALVDAMTGERVHMGSPEAWNNGAEDASSGDRVSWFDFSSVTAPSAYYVLDTENGVRSPVFFVAADVYREVLKHAVRTFFYQRAGQEKAAEFAEEFSRRYRR